MMYFNRLKQPEMNLFVQRMITIHGYQVIIGICFMLFNYTPVATFYETKHLRKELKEMKYDA